ncbi:hypothetical protein D3C86_2117110 [compost metagenome]
MPPAEADERHREVTHLLFRRTPLADRDGARAAIDEEARLAVDEEIRDLVVIEVGGERREERMPLPARP